MTESSSRPVRIALIAGEASGDLLGASLIAQLRRLSPTVEVAGVGGPQMRAAGMDCWHDCAELAVMGIAEVLRHLPRLLRFRRQLRERLLAWNPDVVVGIDSPDFNLGLERRLKQRDVTTIHYVSPSIWAWREGRAKKIESSVRRVLCLFPMEPPIYARYGVDARFVGHPLAQAFPLQPDQASARQHLGLAAESQVLAILPGSRLDEIARLGAVFCAAAVRLRREFPQMVFVAPMANERCDVAFRRVLDSPLPPEADQAPHAPTPEEWAALKDAVRIVRGDAHQVMIAADYLLLASGTAALEGMLAKRPMAVAYRISPITYAIVKGLGLLKVTRYSLPNILSGKDLVPELMQHDCTAEKIAATIADMVRHPLNWSERIGEFIRLHHALTADPSAAAAATLDLLPANAATR